MQPAAWVCPDSETRRELFCRLFDEVVLEQKARLVAWRAITNQSAQISDSTGGLSELVAAIVSGRRGKGYRGRDGDFVGDLEGEMEVKSGNRVDQKLVMVNEVPTNPEDGHFNWSEWTRGRMLQHLDQCNGCYCVSFSFDTEGRFKCEVLYFPYDANARLIMGRRLYARRDNRARLVASGTGKQFQPRHYCAGRAGRGVLPGATRGGASLVSLRAQLLARVVEVDGRAVVDIWEPENPQPIDRCLELTEGNGRVRIHELGEIVLDNQTEHERHEFARRFFQDCFVDYHNALEEFCSQFRCTANIGYDSRGQHIVSLVSGIRGTDSNARGLDLENGGEIKTAVGYSTDDEMENRSDPRWNLGPDIPTIVGYPTFHGNVLRQLNGCQRLKIMVPETMNAFHEAVQAKAGHRNIQFHIRADFEATHYGGCDFTEIFRVIERDQIAEIYQPEEE
jgi:hypothetical protein